jgi:predicted type IV restriction endonuclease
MPITHNEAFSRILIDKALEASSWNLLNDQQIQFEYNNTSGRAEIPTTPRSRPVVMRKI